MGHKASGDTTNEKIEGVVAMIGGEYGNLKIDGVVTINGDLGAQDLDIDGVCTVNGGLSAKDFSCDGILTVQGPVRAETNTDCFVISQRTGRGNRLLTFKLPLILLGPLARMPALP
jgi:cytoskeletal protein CcmA (bactofilin family)